ncbi:MAG: hypothetical protein PVH63_13360 [Balneolaceae bacterium]
MGEINTDVKILSHSINNSASRSFTKEVNRFMRELDKKENNLLNTVKPFEKVDSKLFKYCKKKILETELLEELLPHYQDLISFLNKKKKRLHIVDRYNQKSDGRFVITDHQISEAIKANGGIKKKYIWQMGEDARYTPGRVKHGKLAKDLLENTEVAIHDGVISKKQLGRRIKKLINPNIKRLGDTFKYVP